MVFMPSNSGQNNRYFGCLRIIFLKTFGAFLPRRLEKVLKRPSFQLYSQSSQYTYKRPLHLLSK